jgi:hypothetical protein
LHLSGTFRDGCALLVMFNESMWTEAGEGVARAPLRCCARGLLDGSCCQDALPAPTQGCRVAAYGATPHVLSLQLMWPCWSSSLNNYFPLYLGAMYVERLSTPGNRTWVALLNDSASSWVDESLAVPRWSISYLCCPVGSCIAANSAATCTASVVTAAGC